MYSCTVFKYTIEMLLPLLAPPQSAEKACSHLQNTSILFGLYTHACPLNTLQKDDEQAFPATVNKVKCVRQSSSTLT